MKRLSASKKIADSIQSALRQIEQKQEHDEKKVEQTLQNLRTHGGIDLHLGDHFEINNVGGDAYVASPAGIKAMMIGGAKPSLKGQMYIIGREPGTDRELTYYKIGSSGVQKRECGQAAGRTVSRFDLAIIPSGDRVEIFNIGKNKKDVYFEGEIEF